MPMKSNDAPIDIPPMKKYKTRREQSTAIYAQKIQ
jgi:hypothetical protein